ncbi:MAG: tandem-95 repeat protein [Sphingomonadales bacterium]|jgi:VCBS repeat-containing protein|nr:tandem-95 repeat protein [Sphingomonadales bacterium]MBK9267681.1 tandem-95 repeat protein [Sphingomonadales bacterium]
MDVNTSNITPILPADGTEGAAASVAAAASVYAQFALQAAALVPGQDGQLVLPSGVSLNDIRVVGRDLVVRMPDGTDVVIPDGAIIVPQFVVDGVAVPPVNLAALLIGQEPQPAAGPPQSSGGNFSQAPGDIGDPFGLGDLLPPTELAFPEPEQRELVPGLVDRDPDVNIQDGGPAGKDVIDNVSEVGLPGTRANGNVESPGSSTGNGSDSTTGLIIVNSPDGIASITINGVVYTGAGQQITTPNGVLTLGALEGGQITYTYRLTDNTSGDTTTDVFTVVLTDPDGDTSTARLTIAIADDVPVARNDTDSVAGGTYGPETGNVLSGSGTTSGTSGADTQGADGAAISGFRAGTEGEFVAVGTTINGQYGTLTIGPDGTYSYVRNTNTPGGVSDIFSYRLTDGDGDTSTATLTINIGDAPNRIVFIPEIGEGTQVREPHLPVRDGEPSGSQFDGNAETTSGTITFNSPDGVGSVTVSGVTITPGALPQQVFSDATGTLVITAYSYDPVTGNGSVTYTYTLNDNTLDTSGSTVSFPIVVTDLDGDTASDQLDIHIIDDAPTARNDSAAQASENAAVTVNVITNDTPGADSVNLTTGVAVVPETLTGAGTLAYNGDGTFTYTPTPGEEGTVTFQYTITDGDGDPSTATVTITLLDDSRPQIDVSGENFVDEAGLPVRGSEPAGSNQAADSETTTGTISVSTGDDTLQSLVINGVNVTAGGTVTGAHGTLTVTVSAGAYSYSYTLTDNSSGDATTDSFDIVVTDSDGDSADDTLVVTIHDDVPTAVKDADSIAADEYGPATGNVITDTEGDGGTDVQGADGVTVTAVSGTADGVVGGSTVGQYGVLTLNSDGSYSYTRNPGTPGGVSDIFSYTITDGDGDPSTTTLTISIGDSPTSLDLPTDGEAGTQVDEAGLPAGSDAASDSELTAGTISYTAPDGPATVTIDGDAVVAVGQTFAGSFGTLTITSITAGSIGYEYELTTNTSGDATFDDFAIVVADQDGDSTPGTLVIDIVDDVPTARPDIDSVTEDGPTVADGNVITGANVADANTTDGVIDTKGADGATVTAVAFGATGGIVGSALAGTYGSLTLNDDGSYSYALNNDDPRVQGLDSDDVLTEIFSYTITDGDGDPSTATLTITINGADDRITINGLNGQGPDLIVDEDDLADGSSPDAAALTQTGNFTVNGLDGIASIKIEGTEAFVGQQFATAYGTFTITSISAPANGSATAITVGYSYVLTDNTAHANEDGENFLTELFDVEVTDTDGSTDANQVEVRIIDDVPTAADDTDVIAGGSYGPATGNVITDADAGDAGDSDLGKDIQGADGVTVTAITGFGGDGAVNGTTNGQYGVLTLNSDGSYSYTRNPGTPGSATDIFTYTIADADGDTDTATLTITIEDDRPVVGPNPVVLVDDDSLGGNAASTIGDDTDPQNASGTLSGSGGDGALTWAFQTTGAPAGFQYVAAGSNILVQQDQGGSWVTVATATLVPATGAYTVTLNNNVLHADGDNENNLSVTLNYTVSDVDADSSPGTLTINFDDDAPTATNEPAQSAAEGGSINGTVDFVAGADGASVTHVNGTVLTFGVDGFSQSVDIGDGSIKVKADGTYVFTADNPVIGTGSANATFTITDGDNDTVTATAAFTITDANVPTGGATLASLDDDGLTGGNAASTVDDLAVPNSDGDNNEATFAGTLTHNFGLDGAGTVSFAALDGTNGTVGTETVTYAWSEAAGIGTLTATGPRGLLFTLEVTLSTGAYELKLNDNVLHATGPNQENPVDPTTTLTYVVTDADGSPVNGSLTITFDDDAPTLSVSGATTVVEGASATGTWSQTIGADQPGASTVVDFGGTSYALGTAINTGNGTLTVLANGNWSFVANNNLDNDLNPSVTFTVKVTDADGDVAQDPHTVAITDGAGPSAGGPLALALDDQNLADGSTPANPDFISGTVSFTAGSDALTGFAFADSLAGLGAGLTWTRVSGTLIEGRDGGNLIVSLTLAPPASIAAGANGTATVTATLHDNYDSHPSFTADDLVALGSIGVVASDNDGGSATATVNVTVSDDVPTLSVSGATTVVEGASATGTWSQTIGADQPGASTVVDFGGTSYALGTAINTGNGTLTVLANGNWSFVANNNLDNDLNPSVTFTVKVTDADGDVAQDPHTVAITDGTPAPNAAPIALDLNEAALDTAGATGSNSSLTTETDNTPSLSFTAGSDALTSFQFSTNLGSLVSNLDGAGTDIVWVRAADGQSVTGHLGSAAGPIAVTLTLSAPASIAAGATGNVTVTATLSDNLPHANALLNQIQSLGSILVEARDHDGDVATGQVSINVQDDVPAANADTDSIDEGQASATGNVLSGVGTTNAPGSADVPGADAAVVTGVVAGNVAGPVANGGLGGELVGSYGTLNLASGGGYTYTLNNANTAVQALGVGDTATETFTYTITDADGDKATATLTITINGTNDLPTFNAATASVSEEGFGNANPDDNFAPDDTTNETVTTGSINLVDVDVTDALTVTLGTPAGAIVADGVPLTWALSPDGKTLTGSAGATPIVEVLIDDSGNFTVSLLQPVDHLTANGENVSTFTVPVSVNDGTATVTNNTGLTVRIEDDSPIANPNSNSGVEGAVIIGSVLPNDSFGADGPTATAPAGGVVGVRAAGGDTTSPVTTGTGTQITGQYGKLTLNADGSYSYDGDPNVISSAQSDIFVYTIRDADGDLATTTLTINLTPVTLVADNDTVTVNEAGLDTVNDAGPDTVAGTVNGSNPTSNSDVAQGTLVVAGATNYVLTSASGGSYGTLVLNSNGTYTYTLTKPFDTTPDTNNGVTTETGKDVFNYTATDANGNSINGTITVDIVDDIPVVDIAASGAVLIVDESLGVTGSTQNEGGRVNNDETLAGAAVGAIGYAQGAITNLVTANAGADGEASRVYSLTVNNTNSGLIDSVTNSNIVLVAVNATTIEGRVGGTGGAVSFRITVDPANGTATINQFRAVEHNDSSNHDENGGSEALMNSGVLSMGVAITDGDGDRTSDSADISQAFKFEDDGPLAVADNKVTVVVNENINAAFVLDFSGSIDNDELSEMLSAVKDAGYELFANTTGAVSIRVVLFASDAASYTPVTTFEAFASLIDSFNDQLPGGNRPMDSYTDFTAAIQKLMADYLPSPTANNQVFFLSDGNPNEQTGTGALANSTAAAWNTFVDSNGINVTAIGVGSGINTGPLQDIDVDGSGTPIMAENFDDLIATLIKAVQPPISDNLLTNDTLGTDGGRTQSITINGITYTWNGITTITASSGPAVPQGTTITVPTALGGQMFVNFATGGWTYTPPENYTGSADELFQYSVIDGDGDLSQSTLTIDVSAVTGGSNFAKNEYIFTNQGGTAVIPEGVLLANDTAGTTITGIANTNGATSVVQGGGNITFTDTGTAGGSFVYNAALGAASDTAYVRINQNQAGEGTLDGTGASEVLVGRDGTTGDTLNGYAGNDRLYGLGGNDTLAGGGGNDTLVGGAGDDTLNGGAGSDTMTGGAGTDTFTISSGQSLAVIGGSGNNGTISGYDRITDFDTVNDILDLNGTPSAPPSVGSMNNSTTLTVGGNTIKSHSIANGIVTFDDAETFATALVLTSDSDVAAAVQYLRANDLGSGNNLTVAFVAGGRTFVYQQVGGSPNAANDILVELQGVVLTNLTSLISSGRVSPVALDLDGDGVEFLSATAGARFDFNGDGDAEATAWVSGDDGLLALDRNGDGLINDRSELVFARDGLTDLEGLAADYDSNKDGVLDANDVDFASFGVWQDADSDGVTDAGEFKSLTDAGIASIKLVSDGNAYSAADGDVTVHGTSSYTTANGDSFDVADASFATGGGAKVAANENDQRVLAAGTGGIASSMVAAGLVAAVATAPELESELSGKVGGGEFAIRGFIESAAVDGQFEAPDHSALLDRSHGSGSFDRIEQTAAAKFSSYEQAEDHAIGDIGSFGGHDSGSLISELLAPTEIEHAAYARPDFAIGVQVDAASEALIAIQQGDMFAKAAIEEVVADALSGGFGDGANVDALLNALAGPANDLPLLGNTLAQQLGDQPVFEALSFGTPNDMLDQLTSAHMELSAATGHHG